MRIKEFQVFSSVEYFQETCFGSNHIKYEANVENCIPLTSKPIRLCKTLAKTILGYTSVLYSFSFLPPCFRHLASTCFTSLLGARTIERAFQSYYFYGTHDDSHTQNFAENNTKSPFDEI